MNPSKEKQLFAELWSVADKLAEVSNADQAADLYQEFCRILFKYEKGYDEEEEE